MISRGPSLSPVWGDHSGIAGSSFASTAQGEKADAADTDIDNIYTKLVAIGAPMFPKPIKPIVGVFIRNSCLLFSFCTIRV